MLIVSAWRHPPGRLGGLEAHALGGSAVLGFSWGALGSAFGAILDGVVAVLAAVERSLGGLEVVLGVAH